MRLLSSAVAAFVKVTTRRLLIGISCSTISLSTRCLIEKVLPVPADASRSVGTVRSAFSTTKPSLSADFTARDSSCSGSDAGASSKKSSGTQDSCAAAQSSTSAHDGTSSQYSGTASQAAAASPSLSSESGGTASKREFVSLVILLVILRRFSHGLEGLVHLFFKSGHQFFVLCLLEQLLLEKLEAHLAPFVRNPAHPV